MYDAVTDVARRDRNRSRSEMKSWSRAGEGDDARTEQLSARVDEEHS